MDRTHGSRRTRERENGWQNRWKPCWKVGAVHLSIESETSQEGEKSMACPWTDCATAQRPVFLGTFFRLQSREKLTKRWKVSKTENSPTQYTYMYISPISPLHRLVSTLLDCCCFLERFFSFRDFVVDFCQSGRQVSKQISSMTFSVKIKERWLFAYPVFTMSTCT